MRSVGVFEATWVINFLECVMRELKTVSYQTCTNEINDFLFHQFRWRLITCVCIATSSSTWINVSNVLYIFL